MLNVKKTNTSAAAGIISRGEILGTDPVAEFDELMARIKMAVLELPCNERDNIINAINNAILEYYEDRLIP